MGATVQTNVGIVIGTTDYTGISNRVEMTYGVDLLDGSTFALTSPTHRKKVPGLFDVGINISGFWDGAKDLPMHALVGTEDVLCSICSLTTTRGSPAYTTKLNTAELTRGGAVSDILPFAITAQGNDVLRRTFTLYNFVTTHSASGNGLFITPNGTVDIPNGLTTFLDLHILQVSGVNPTLDYVLQVDDNVSFTTPTDIMGGSSGFPLTQITDINAPAVFRYQRSVNYGVGEFYFRLNRTIGGSGSPNFVISALMSISAS